MRSSLWKKQLEATTKAQQPEHRCGVNGFATGRRRHGMLGDVCPACEAERDKALDVDLDAVLAFAKTQAVFMGKTDILRRIWRIHEVRSGG